MKNMKKKKKKHFKLHIDRGWTLNLKQAQRQSLKACKQMSIILPTFSLLDRNQCFHTKCKPVHTVLAVLGNVIKEMCAVACPSFHSNKTEGKVGISCLLLNSFSVLQHGFVLAHLLLFERNFPLSELLCHKSFTKRWQERKNHLTNEISSQKCQTKSAPFCCW